MTAFRAAVLEHFRRPHNRGHLENVNAWFEGGNPLCGDRIRIELLIEDGVVQDAGFVADACAICIASASVVTEHARGKRMTELARLDVTTVHAALGGAPPAGRERCAELPVDALRRAGAGAADRGVVAGLLLAAGGSRRFGSQKLLAPLDGEPLVRPAARALAAQTDTLVVVVGRERDAVVHAIADFEPTIVDNAAWADGLGGSVARGVAALPDDVEAVVVALGDQPRIDAAVTRAVIDAWRATGQPIVAPRYRGRRGHPVLFDRAMFPELRALTGDVGARDVIEAAASRVAYVDVDAELPRDVDTLGDLARA